MVNKEHTFEISRIKLVYIYDFYIIAIEGMCEANECYQCAWIRGLDDVQDCADPSGSTPTVECNASCLVRVNSDKDELW